MLNVHSARDGWQDGCSIPVIARYPAAPHALFACRSRLCVPAIYAAASKRRAISTPIRAPLRNAVAQEEDRASAGSQNRSGRPSLTLKVSANLRDMRDQAAKTWDKPRPVIAKYREWQSPGELFRKVGLNRHHMPMDPELGCALLTTERGTGRAATSRKQIRHTAGRGYRAGSFRDNEVPLATCTHWPTTWHLPCALHRVGPRPWRTLVV